MGRQLKTATRPITNAGHHKVIGEIPSIKCGVMLPWECSLERDYLYLCEYDPRIVSIESQPEKVTIWIDGVSHKYTPDYRVVFDDGEIRIAEVKPDEKLSMSDSFVVDGSLIVLPSRGRPLSGRQIGCVQPARDRRSG